MISGGRFVARSSDREAWLEARSFGVTATMVAEGASGPAGFRNVLERRNGAVEVNAFMEWGTFMEPVLARHAHLETVKDGSRCVLPNDWLIASEENPRFLATPDGLSIDHTRIGEYKTMGKPLEAPPLPHVRQMQWQMLVTGAKSCVYVWQLRVEAGGRFVPGWIEPRMVQVRRDENMISELVEVAEKLLKEIDNGI